MVPSAYIVLVAGLLPQLIIASNLVRVDALLVTRGLCSSRAVRLPALLPICDRPPPHR